MMNHVVWGGPNAPELNAALAHWACEKLDITRGFGPCTTMGVFKDATDPIAVMVYHNWMPENGVIEISGAATTSRWLTRPVLWEMFSYPFNQLGNQLVVMRVSERNRRENGRGLPRLLDSYGFKAYPIPRLRGRDEGEIIYTLTDDDWRANGFHKEVTDGKKRPGVS